MSSKGAYLILTHVHQPINKGPNKGKMQTHESCEFVDRYKRKHLQGATIIMDVVKREFVKNTYRQEGLSYDQVEEHVIKGYADKYTQFLQLVGAPVPEALLLGKEEVEKEMTEENEQIVVEDDEGNAPQRKRKKIQEELIEKAKVESDKEEK